MLKNRFSTSAFGLTIAVTSDCNLRCIYCYEKDVISPGKMTKEVQEKIVEALRNQAKTLSSFSVTWYGGEPLLAIDVIENLSKEFIEICKDNNITYGAGIITNGYLLTRDVLELLNKYNITFIQVTIDGMPEVHNKRRPLANGEGTFETIMKNLEENYDLLPRTSLRINVDKNNLDTGTDIYKYLLEKNILEKVKPYYGKTSNDNNNYIDSECLSTCDYAKADFQLLMQVSQNKNAFIRYPDYKTNFCGADFVNSAVVGSDGRLYKCWSDIGIDKKCIGNVLTGSNIDNKLLFRGK